jgi:peptide methionine sulfoxide reductase MsrA
MRGAYYYQLPLLLLTLLSCWDRGATGLAVPKNGRVNLGQQRSRVTTNFESQQLPSVVHHKPSTSSSSSDNASFPSRQRRKLLQGSLTSAVTALLVTTAASASTILPQPSHAATAPFAQQDDHADDELVDVYFGCGCFWHVQEIFVQLEKSLLQRSDLQLTSRAGYAGGRRKANANAAAGDGKVCYHNAAQIGDYGTLGHAEVVSMQIPKSTFTRFAAEYCSLFSKEGYRPDQLGDRGPEYRNLVGLPGGVTSPLAKELVDASIQNGDKLDFAKGKGGGGEKGGDPDARGLVFIMDTADFPFYVAEQYHQFHDGFNFGENYPSSYNDIAGKLAKEGKLGQSSCPNGLLGLGALGL